MVPLPSLLVTFDDVEHLARTVGELERGAILADAEGVELAEGDACEVVLVHPDSGDSLLLDAQVAEVGEEGVQLSVGVTPLVRNRLRKFAGDALERTNIQQRLRAMGATERRHIALAGELHERVALERIYGKAVWESLLKNPKLTVPEVARLARMGNLPRPLLEQIANNAGWVKTPQVRRALLTNPRLDGMLAQRVLRLLPKLELKVLPQQTAYPASVRTAAAKMLKRR